MKVTLQLDMKLTCITFKSLVGALGDEGEVCIDVLGSGLREIPLFLPGWPR